MIEISDAFVTIPAMFGIKLHACSAITAEQDIFMDLMVPLFSLYHQGINRVNGHCKNATEHCQRKRGHKQNGEHFIAFKTKAVAIRDMIDMILATTSVEAIGPDSHRIYSFKCRIGDMTYLASGCFLYIHTYATRQAIQASLLYRLCSCGWQERVQKEEIRNSIAEANRYCNHLPEGERTCRPSQPSQPSQPWRPLRHYKRLYDPWRKYS